MYSVKYDTVRIVTLQTSVDDGFVKHVKHLKNSTSTISYSWWEEKSFFYYIGFWLFQS